MGSSSVLRVYMFIGIVILIFALFAFYWGFKSSIDDITPVEQKPQTSEVKTQPPAPLPSVRIEKISSRKIRVIWDNIPEDASRLEIFRSLLGKDKWEKWKVIELLPGSGTSGSMEFDLGKGENADNYEFYSQAVSGNGSTVYTGPTETAQPPTNPPSSASPSSTSTPTSNPTPTSSTPITPTSTPTSTASATPTSTTTSTQQGTGVVVEGNVGYYYTPSMGISGTSTIISQLNFWVQHVNRNIEIGWQNLPTPTTRVITYRATSENGNYEKLFEQGNIDPIGPIHIRLVDSSIEEDHWYKIEAKAGETLIGTYGPTLLPGLK